MASQFRQTLRALGRDRFLPSGKGFLISIVLIGVWGAWFFFSGVKVLESTSQARLEVTDAPHPVEGLVTGRVVRSHLALGKRVKKDEILVELDAEESRYTVEEKRAAIASMGPQLEAIRRERAAEDSGMLGRQGVGRADRASAAASLREAESALRLARNEVALFDSLRSQELVSELEVVRKRADVERLAARVDSLRSELSRLPFDLQNKESDQRVQLERLSGQEARVEGDLAAARSAVARLEAELAWHTIRAPIDGVLASIVDLRPGTVVNKGDSLASILPDAGLKVVAQFPPSALGRLWINQRGWLRLDGFPWTQYGAVMLRVSAVAGEVRDGKVRVDLDVVPDRPTTIPLQHGLPGTVEVEVETVSPATLVLRAAGGAVAPRRAEGATSP